MRGLVFLWMVTLERSEAVGSRVERLEMRRGLGDKDSTVLGNLKEESKVGPPRVK
jgi:hypothetical protein